MCLKKVIV